MRDDRRAGQDRHLRDPLPGGGRRLRRPDRADRQGPGRRRRPGDRDQGAGGLAHDQGNAARTPTPPRCARCPVCSAADRHGDAVILSCSDADAALRALLGAFPGLRDLEVRGGSLEEAFMELTADRATPPARCHGGSTMSGATHFRYEVLRDVLRNRVFYVVTLALPLVLFFGVASGQRHATFNGTSFPLYFMTAMAVYGSMFAVVGPGARIARDIAGGWTRQLRIDAAAGTHRPHRQGGHRLPAGAADAGAALPGWRVARGSPGRQPVAGDDRADPGRPCPVRRHRVRPRATSCRSTR